MGLVKTHVPKSERVDRTDEILARKTVNLVYNMAIGANPSYNGDELCKLIGRQIKGEHFDRAWGMLSYALPAFREFDKEEMFLRAVALAGCLAQEALKKGELQMANSIANYSGGHDPYTSIRLAEKTNILESGIRFREMLMDTFLKTVVTYEQIKDPTIYLRTIPPQMMPSPLMT